VIKRVVQKKRIFLNLSVLFPNIISILTYLILFSTNPYF